MHPSWLATRIGGTMTAIAVLMAVWALAIALFVLVGAEIKRVDAAAEVAARRHTSWCGSASLASPERRVAEGARTRSKSACRHFS